MSLLALAQEHAAGSSIPRLGLDLLILLASAAVVATLFRRFRLELIPGYLIAGAIVGPGALKLIGDSEALEAASDLAIILLLFGIGLELDFGSIRRGMVHILGAGVVSTAVSTLICWGVLLLAGVPAPAGLLIAMALAMSSTAVLVRTLSARREARSPVGRVTLGVAIVQDLLAVAVMALIPPLALWAGAELTGLTGQAEAQADLPRWGGVMLQAIIGLGGVAAMLAAGRLGLPRLLQTVARIGSGELVLVVSATVALGAAVATSVLDFSPHMGAFLAGLLLAGTPFRYQLAGQIAPMRDLLMAVFFTAVGMKVAPQDVLQDWWIVGLGAIGLMALKFLVIGATAWGAGMTAPSALVAGAYLANAGEFSLVVLGAAGVVGILEPQELGLTITMVIVTLMLSPFLAGPSRRWSERLARIPTAPWISGAVLRERPPPAERAASAQAAQPASEPPHRPRNVIIAGFGPVGRTLADRFSVAGVPFTVIELNPKTVERQTVLGRPVIYGDVTNAEVLESAGIRHADAIILTIPDDEATLRACKAIRAIAPDVFIAARTNFLSGKFVAHQLGADLVVVEELATAQAMEKEILAKLKEWLDQPSGYRAGNGEA
jgi:Kef-type K+ transport system membrane component KefB